MKFSVVVPFLNEEKYIRQCIKSLVEQDFDKNEYELIFVDNGSTDASNAIVAGYKEIILLHEPKQNVYTARNTALQKAKGEIIAFTDADCAVRKDWLTQLYRGIQSNAAGIVLGKVCLPTTTSSLLKLFEEYQNAKIEFVLDRYEKEYYFGYTNNMAVRSEIFRELGGFVEWPVPGDTELVQRYAARAHNGKIAYLDQAVVTHLEVSALSVWFKKTYLYGKHNMLIKDTQDYKELGITKKLQIFSYSCNKHGYSVLRAGTFLLLVAFGNLVYKTGAIIGKMSKLKLVFLLLKRHQLNIDFERLSAAEFNLMNAYFSFLRILIRSLISWKNRPRSKPGYSIIIGCNVPLAAMLKTTCMMLSKQKRAHLERIIIIFDTPQDKIAIPIESMIRKEFPDLPVTFLYYNRFQSWLAHAIRHESIFSWLSWCKGISAAETRYVFLHDFDAMLLKNNFIEERYERISSGALHYCGIAHYHSNGFLEKDGFLITTELFLDADFIQKTFRPVDLFNVMRMYGGRRLLFDTFLSAQSRAGNKGIFPIDDENDWVHSFQMISQFTRLTLRPGYIPPPANNLLFIPYYLYLAGETTVLPAHCQNLKESNGESVALIGVTMNISRLTTDHLDWIIRKINQLEMAFFGGVRKAPATYCEALRELSKKKLSAA